MPRRRIKRSRDSSSSAMGVSGDDGLRGPAQRSAPPASPTRDRTTACNARRAQARRHCEAGRSAHLAPLLRDALARSRLRYSHRAGTFGASGCEDDDDLHPRPQPRWLWCAEPGRWGARPRPGGAIASGMGFVSAWCVPGGSRTKSLGIQHDGPHDRQTRRCGYDALSAWVRVFIRTPKCSWGPSRPRLW